MSSESNLELLNRILDAKWDLHTAAPEQKDEALSALDTLLDQALVGHNDISRADRDRL